MAYKIDRANEIIKNEISSLISRMKDPRLSEYVISIVRVKTTPDMKYAKVLVSIMADESKQQEALGILVNARGYIRKGLSSVLTTKFTPEIIFELDDSINYAMHIDEVLRKINEQPESDSGE
ncbi:MAG: 30S ribosome-binding factor RbfA [Eubacteriaceae bacterium]|jgi:ribosome-binding factor A|nr:30S ribosome-binding factor RbfA [Eubacteriaceae bacterium]